MITPEFTYRSGSRRFEPGVGSSTSALNTTRKSVGASQSNGDVAGVSGPAISHCVVMNGTVAAARRGRRGVDLEVPEHLVAGTSMDRWAESPDALAAFSWGRATARRP